MKRTILCLLCMVAALCIIASPSIAKTETELDPIWLTGSRTWGKNSEIVIETDTLYYINQRGNWFNFTASENGKHVYAMKCTSDHIYFRFYDQYSELMGEYFVNAGQSGNLEFELKQGRQYFVRLTGNSAGVMYDSASCYFSVCSPSNHVQLTEQKVIQEPTCQQDGYSEQVCLACYTGFNRVVLPKTEHVPGEWQVVKESNCIVQGEKEIRCLNCDIVLEHEMLPLTGHVAGTMKTVKPATCTEAGMNEQHCTVCNITMSTETPAALGHTPGAWVDTLAATCTAEGVRTQYCEACHAVLATEAIPAHGHRAMEWQEAREAACLQSGLKEKKCSDCGVVLEREQINALGHSYTEWETILEATKELEGEKRRHCIHCGDTQFEKIEKLPKILGIF